jgi:NAD(P)-dependent dehydrogenase (short-subunit alcohol dehydrogenase family)
MDVVLADVHAARLAEARQEVAARGVRALAVECDLARDPDVERLAATALAEMGQVDLLMNNAGVVLCGALEQLTTADWEWQFGINVLGVVRGVRAFLPHMLARGSGYIVNTASLAGLFALTGAGAPYIASKFAVVGYTEALALYLEPRGIRVSLLCPGGVKTNLHETGRVVGLTPEELAADTAAAQAAYGGEETTPEAVAAQVVAAVEAERFFVLTDPSQQRFVVERAADWEVFLRARLAHGLAPRPSVADERADEVESARG